MMDGEIDEDDALWKMILELLDDGSDLQKEVSLVAAKRARRIKDVKTSLV